jgi:hypothetical protein
MVLNNQPPPTATPCEPQRRRCPDSASNARDALVMRRSSIRFRYAAPPSDQGTELVTIPAIAARIHFSHDMANRPSTK